MSGESNSADFSEAVERRYRDAYVIAATIVGFGDTIKALGIAFGALLLVAALVIATKGVGGVLVALVIAAAAIGAGIVLYFLGIVVAAQGQILKALLDTAVNSSPFLSDSARAGIMTLPSARPPSGGASGDIQASLGPWRCASCGKGNPATVQQCQMCGEARIG